MISPAPHEYSQTDCGFTRDCPKEHLPKHGAATSSPIHVLGVVVIWAFLVQLGHVPVNASQFPAVVR